MSYPDNQPAATEDDEAYEQEAPLRLSRWAVASCILSALAFFLFATPAGFPLAFVAVLTGHAGGHVIKRGRADGKWWAIAGLTLGYLLMALTIVANFISRR